MRPEAERAVGPDVNLAHFTNCAGLNVFDGSAPVVGRMALIAHLRGDLGFLGAPRQLPGFINRPGKRLLHVDVFSQSHRGKGDVRVHVIGRGDEDGVDVLLMLEHIAIVLIALGLRQVLILQTNHSLQAGLGLNAIELDGGLAGNGLRIRLIETFLQVGDFVSSRSNDLPA